MANKDGLRDTQRRPAEKQRVHAGHDTAELSSAEANVGRIVEHPIHSLQHLVGNAWVARSLADRLPSRYGNAEPLSRPWAGLAGGPISNRLASRIYGNLGGGRPLSNGDRTRWERRYGVPLESVRIHDDHEATALALSIGGQAFTLGKDIFLGQSASSADQRLLEHEVAHVVQQRGAPVNGILVVGSADSALEREAEDAATGAEAEAMPSLSESTGATVQRDRRDITPEPEDAFGVMSDIITVLGTPGLGTPGSPLGDLNDAAGPTGTIASVLGFGQGMDQMLNAPNTGEQITGGTDALFNTLGAFSSGVSTAGLLGVSGLAALGPAALVAGYGASAYSGTRLLDRAIGAIGSAITGNKERDYSGTGLIADAALGIDKSLSSLWADPDRPAHTQTLGWKLGELLGI